MNHDTMLLMLPLLGGVVCAVICYWKWRLEAPEELVAANAKYKVYAKRAAEPMPFYAWLQFWLWGRQGGACSFNDPACGTAAGRKGKAAQLAGMEAARVASEQERRECQE